MVPSLIRWQAGLNLPEDEQKVKCSNDIVDLGENRMLAVNHGIGSGSLLSEMDYRLGLKILDRGCEEIVVGYVADK